MNACDFNDQTQCPYDFNEWYDYENDPEVLNAHRCDDYPDRDDDDDFGPEPYIAYLDDPNPWVVEWQANYGRHAAFYEWCCKFLPPDDDDIPF